MLVWLVREARHSYESMDHTLIVRSYDAEMILLSSGVAATQMTYPVCPMVVHNNANVSDSAALGEVWEISWH